MKATFLHGFKPLAKRFTKDGVEPYPMVKKVSSKVFDLPLDATGLRQKFEICVAQANMGACMLKGELDGNLVKESRAGRTRAQQPSQTLLLDFDGLSLTGVPTGSHYTGDDLRHLAEHLVTLLPDPLQNTSYIAHASASMGMKKGLVSMHMEFWLDAPIQPDAQKNVLRYFNLMDETLASNLTLNAIGTGLCWPLDICTADNSRMIFIGTPQFDGVDNPIPDDTDRFQFVEHQNTLISVIELMNWFDGNDLKKRQKKVLNALQEANGLDTRKSDRYKNVIIDGFKHRVVSNPNEIEMEPHSFYEHYVTYNVSGGDSHAYYVLKHNPTVVYNWKGEPPFLFQKANPDQYEAHIEEYGIEGDGDGMPLGFRDPTSDLHFSGIYDPAAKKLHEVNPIQKSNMADFFADRGGIMPDPIPQIDYLFRPQDHRSVDIRNRFINRFDEPPLLANHDGLDLIEWNQLHTHIEDQCPTLYKILLSVTGDGILELQRFLNWLAWVVQTKGKTGVAWLFQGTQGTGKGVLFNHVLRPIFAEYAVEKRLSNVEDEFNSWIETALIAAIDEFKVGRNSRGDAFMEKFKHKISEPFVTVRGMRANQREVLNFTNWLLFTNEHDALPIENGDRRMNVCPRQEIKLNERYPDIMDDIKKKLPEEIKKFANLLHACETDEGLAQVVLENDAKQIMRETSMTSVEVFCSALRQGNFEFFAELLDRQPGMGTGDDTTILLSCQNTLRGWMKQILDGKQEVLTTPAELRPLYMMLVGNIQTDHKLRQLLAKKAIVPQQRRVGDSVVRRISIKLRSDDWQALARRYLHRTAPSYDQLGDSNEQNTA